MEHLMWNEIERKYQQSEYDSQNIAQLLKKEIEKSGLKLVVLDDDPTGVQTVHGVYVYTDWKYESVLQGFMGKERLFYLLTNSRGLTEEQTTQLHREIVQNVIRASRQTGKKFLIISRSDSTLRGHYPLETKLLKEELEEGGGIRVDAEVLIPFFQAGGRFTIDNVHYVKYGEELIPAAETEFANDKTFGYTKSDLCEYIEEKTQGAYRSGDVAAVSLEEIRSAKLDSIEKVLEGMTGFGKVIVNAIEPKDLEVFSVALYRAIRKGKYFLLRTAADFVRAAGGIAEKALLTKADMLGEGSRQGGIVVIGSHTAKTTEQLLALRHMEQLVFFEFNSDLVLEDRLEEEVKRVTELSSMCIRQGKTVVTYTRRTVLTLENDTKEDALLRSVKISEAVQQLVQNLTVVPEFVVAKGGITSSDIGVKALQVRKAYVLGQVLPGIPVWKTDAGSRFPGIPYIIFPGNVGEDDSLRRVLEELL
ncbi:MAG TPA: hydroxyacid dehydrogenase [Clostridiales bacterium]|nr:hydroxyacid dehydrogenase [Clostridiales bacterium]